jgi:hypothetical protein
MPLDVDEKYIKCTLILIQARILALIWDEVPTMVEIAIF